ARVDEDGDGAGLEAESLADRVVVDLVDVADLDEVVARADGAQLVAAALDGALADVVRFGAGQGAAGLDVVEVARGAVALFDCPGCAALEHSLDLGGAELEGLVAAADA